MRTHEPRARRRIPADGGDADRDQVAHAAAAAAGGRAPIEDDPRAELVRRLLEYEQMKQAAQALDELPQAGRDLIAISVWIERSVAERLPEVTPQDLRGLAQPAAPRAA